MRRPVCLLALAAGFWISSSRAWKQPVSVDADVGIGGFLKGAGPILSDPKGHPAYPGTDDEGSQREAPRGREEDHLDRSVRKTAAEIRDIKIEEPVSKIYKEVEESQPQPQHGEPLPPSQESSHVGRVVILEFGGLVILASLTFAMANSANPKLRNFTWHTIDNIVCIFLAVLVFQAVDEVLVDSGVIPETHLLIGSLLYAIFALAAAISISYLLKGVPAHFAVFAAASGHFVSFAFMHAATVQMEYQAGNLLHAVGVFISVMIVLPIVFAGMLYFKNYLGITADPELSEKIDDVENDAGAMAAAISWTFVVCFSISGRFQDVEDQEVVAARERRSMLVYAIMLMVASFAMLIAMANSNTGDNVGSGSYIWKRARSFFASFAAMCVAWAFLLWGKWTFHGHHYVESQIFGRVVFAIVASFVGIGVIAGMSQFNLDHRTGKYEHFLVLSVIGLLVGWAWEDVFDGSIESLANDLAPNHVGHIKVVTMLVMLATVLPVHLMYFKPIVMKMQDESDDK